MPSAPSSSESASKSAERSAAERAATEAAIRRKVACDKAAYDVQWTLLEPGVSDADMAAAAQVLQPMHYEDVVSERGLDGLCGYPPCTKSAPRRGQGPKMHVSLSERKVYDVSTLHNFCGRECARRSHEFATSLSSTSLFLRSGAVPVGSPRQQPVPSAAAAAPQPALPTTTAHPSVPVPAPPPPVPPVPQQSGATSDGDATLRAVAERPVAPQPNLRFPPPESAGMVEGYATRYLGGATASNTAPQAQRQPAASARSCRAGGAATAAAVRMNYGA